jgi:acyl-CoA:6-aminopenicillanic acid acyl transferase
MRSIIVSSLLSLFMLSACGSGESSNKFEPSLSKHGNINILRLVGTPYEMGLQHGELMAAEIQDLATFTVEDQGYSLLLAVAETSGLTDTALIFSYQDVLDECRGMVEATDNAGVTDWSYRKCVTAAYLLVVLENTVGWTGGCSQFVASGAATKDGQMIHARNLDWPPIPPLVEHPTLIVRRTEGKPAYVEIGLPGVAFSLSAINENGLTTSINECTADTDRDEEGASHPQMARQVLQDAKSIAEVETFIRAQNHATAETLVVSDWSTGEAAAFEMSANHIGVRKISADGVLYATNHFAHPDMEAVHQERLEDHDTRTRYMRLEQLLEPGGADSLHGQIDPAVAISILRDTYNPYTQETHPPDLIDGGGSIGNNGAVHAMIFLPQKRVFYVSMGEQPIPPATFVGFSLDELLEKKDAMPPDPLEYE